MAPRTRCRDSLVSLALDKPIAVFPAARFTVHSKPTSFSHVRRLVDMSKAHVGMIGYRITNIQWGFSLLHAESRGFWDRSFPLSMDYVDELIMFAFNPIMMK